MTLAQRLSYFGSGLFIGSIFLIFFFSGKKATCDYSPTARVLKNIRIKKRVFTNESLSTLKSVQLDTSEISKILYSGDVDFSKSNTKMDSCKIYIVNGISGNKSLELTIKNCEKQAKIEHINITQLVDTN